MRPPRAYLGAVLRSGCLSQFRQTSRRPRQPAGVVAWQAVTANDRAHRVDRTTRGNAYAARQCRASFSIAPHPRAICCDHGLGDQCDLGLTFEREARPCTRMSAARPARLAGTVAVGSSAHVRPMADFGPRSGAIWLLILRNFLTLVLHNPPASDGMSPFP